MVWAKVYAVANKEMVLAYWNVGREIVEKQQAKLKLVKKGMLQDLLTGKVRMQG